MKAATRSPKFVSENEVRVTKAFLKNAMVFGTPEYKLWKEIRLDCPNAVMITKDIKRNPNKRTYRNMTYKNMVAYHMMPKYLLGLEEKPPEPAILFADRYEDQCRFLIQNSISDPQSFGFPAEQSLDEQLDYIKSITTLGSVPVSTARSIMEVSAKTPSLRRINTAQKPNRSKFPQGLLPPPRQLMSLGTDSPEYKEANEAWRKLQVTLDCLYENNPEWLIFIAQAIAKGPKCFSSLVEFARLGGFTASEQTP